jgi:hypothetical protein
MIFCNVEPLKAWSCHVVRCTVHYSKSTFFAHCHFVYRIVDIPTRPLLFFAIFLVDMTSASSNCYITRCCNKRWMPGSIGRMIVVFGYMDQYQSETLLTGISGLWTWKCRSSAGKMDGSNEWTIQITTLSCLSRALRHLRTEAHTVCT